MVYIYYKYIINILKNFNKYYIFIIFNFYFISFLNIQCIAQNTSTSSIFWGDLHTHSELSFDSECPTDELYKYARNSSQLDFVLVSEHDIRSSHNDWIISKKKANQFYDPGAFVTFIGYEWTGDAGEIGGHRIVLYPGEDATRFSFKSRNYDHISKLIPAVQREGGIMIIAHPDATSYANLQVDNIRTQIGIEFIGTRNARFEYYGNERSHELQILGNSVRDALENGLIVGAIGVSDSHNCTPGNTGLTAVIADSLNRKSIFRAIKNRKTYATSGARIYLEFYSDELKMGEIYTYTPGEIPLIPPEFKFFIRGTDIISNVQIIKNSEIIYDSGEINVNEYSSSVLDSKNITDATYYYLRVKQRDGHIAWSSPIFFKDERELYNLPTQEDISLHAYFNHGNNNVNVSYYLNESQNINIVLYDTIGRRVKYLKNGLANNGINQISFNTSGLANGLYFVNLTTQNTSITKKTLIIR